MPPDLDAIAPQQRNGYIGLGANTARSCVLEQADDIVTALTSWPPEVGKRGCGPRDLQRPTDAIMAHLEAGTQRRGAKANLRAATVEYGKALEQAKQARSYADGVLRGARSDLADAGEHELVKKLVITLEGVSSSSNAPALRDQPTRLRERLVLEPVVTATADRGGTDAVAAIDAALVLPRDAEKDRPGKSGTPAETEKLDLLDGITSTSPAGPAAPPRWASRTSPTASSWTFSTAAPAAAAEAIPPTRHPRRRPSARRCRLFPILPLRTTCYLRESHEVRARLRRVSSHLAHSNWFQDVGQTHTA